MQMRINSNISYLENKLKIRKYVGEYIDSIKKVFIVGQQNERIDFVTNILLENDICGVKKGNEREWERDLQISQKMLMDAEIDGIIIADAYCVTGYEKRLWMVEKLDRVFEVPFYIFRKKKNEIEDEDIVNIFSPMLINGRIGEIQFNLTDKCNLNCNLCSHFSPLVNKEEIYSIDNFVKDAERIVDLTEHVDVIGLWGGESLLHPQLDEIIGECRRVFPDSRIELGTNGLLIPKISVKLLLAIKKNNCKVVISGYLPTMKKWGEIKDYLETFGILYRITSVTQFFRHYDLSGNNEVLHNYAECCSKVCHTVINGRYSSCYFPIVAHIFNECFNEKFEVEDSIYDLYDEELDMLRFTANIKSAVNACRYCGKKTYEDWRMYDTSKKDVEDWIKTT